MKYRFIGDCHGKIAEYLAICSGCERSVQVGDMGLGFKGVYLPHDEVISHRFVRGNHDDPNACAEHPYWIEDGTYKDGIMYIGGAWSIDREYRTEGVSWWRDEELSMEELNNIVDMAVKNKPRVMVTHDCPTSVLDKIFGYPYIIKTRTGQALDTILELCKPKLWIFGHHHKDVDKVIDGTRFICLNELSFIDLTL